MDDRRQRFEAQALPHLDAAYRFARWLSRSPADADDIVQDAVLRAFRAFDDMRGADAKAWLLAIVKNCCATRMSREAKRSQVPLPEEYDVEDGHTMIADTPDPETESIREDQRRVLTRLLAALPEEHREVLVLRELEDMDYRQIASVTRVPIGTVMSRLARARAALKSSWQSEVDGGS